MEEHEKHDPLVALTPREKGWFPGKPSQNDLENLKMCALGDPAKRGAMVKLHTEGKKGGGKPWFTGDTIKGKAFPGLGASMILRKSGLALGEPPKFKRFAG